MSYHMKARLWGAATLLLMFASTFAGLRPDSDHVAFCVWIIGTLLIAVTSPLFGVNLARAQRER